MRTALVVFESVFGDARAVARAIADGLSDSVETEVVAADEAPPEIGPDVSLLVVGCPNHALGMPRPSTRRSAVQKQGADIPDPGHGLREWLAEVRVARPGLSAAAFDTRMAGHPVVTTLDHASRTEEKLLHKLGATVVAPAQHFYADMTGPLQDGEQDRARDWGRHLAELVPEQR